MFSTKGVFSAISFINLNLGYSLKFWKLGKIKTLCIYSTINFIQLLWFGGLKQYIANCRFSFCWNTF